MPFANKKKRRAASEAQAMRNAVDTLWANLRFAAGYQGLSSVVVTSAVPDEGKSTVAVALAKAAARSGMEACLVECDLRNRSLAGALGNPAAGNGSGGGGLMAVLTGESALDEALAETGVPGLSLLDCEPGVPSPTDVLSSVRMERLLRRLERSFGLVVIDTPPLCAFVDAAVLAGKAGGALIVAREGAARRRELAEARSQLEHAGARVLGAVMNGCSDAEDSYDRYYRKGR